MGKIAFVFAGQGSQYPGMGKDLYDNIKESKDIFIEANNALGFDIAKMCFEGPKEKLDVTENTQPAVLTVSIAALYALLKAGIKPDIVAGLSLGEYSALVCSGVFDFSTAVKLVKKRGKYMQEAVPQGKGAMAAVLGLDGDKVKEACIEAKSAGYAAPSNFNCPGQVVIGGEVDAVKRACEIANRIGARRTIMLHVSGPFHTKMLKPASEKLAGELENIELNDMNIPVITNVTGDFIKDKSQVKELLKNQVISSVLWEKTIRLMIKNGVDTFVELGPGKVLSGFVKKIDRKLTILNVEDMNSLETTINSLKGKEE